MRHQALILGLLLILATPVAAQMDADVLFKKGNYGTMVSGTITGHEYFDYRLGANAGQQMKYDLLSRYISAIMAFRRLARSMKSCSVI